MAEISPPDCGSSDCPTPSPCNDDKEIIFTDQVLSTDNIISLNSLNTEIKDIIYTELIHTLNV